MKLLVVSDSHGNNEALTCLTNMYPNMYAYLHAGDSESDESNIFPFQSVKGNCDIYSSFNGRLMLSTPYGYLLMTHKEEYDFEKLKKENIKIYIHGHTHRRKIIEKDGIYVINPGSISFPRDENNLSYAIIDIKSDSVTISFKSLDTK